MRFVITQHAAKHMSERGIRIEEAKEAALWGEVIEDDPDDTPYPSTLKYRNGLHVVSAVVEDVVYIITVYHPDPAKWSDDLKTRRENT